MSKYKDKRFITTTFINALCLAIPYALLDFKSFVFLLGLHIVASLDKLNHRQETYNLLLKEANDIIRNRTK